MGYLPTNLPFMKKKTLFQKSHATVPLSMVPNLPTGTVKHQISVMYPYSGHLRYILGFSHYRRMKQ